MYPNVAACYYLDFQKGSLLEYSVHRVQEKIAQVKYLVQLMPYSFLLNTDSLEQDKSGVEITQTIDTQLRKEESSVCTSKDTGKWKCHP